MANRSPHTADIDAALEHLTAATMLLHADSYHEAREKLKEACRHLSITLLDDVVKEQQQIRDRKAAAQLMKGFPAQDNNDLSAGMQVLKPNPIFDPKA